MFKELVKLLRRYIEIQEQAAVREQEILRDQRRRIYVDLLKPFVMMFSGIKNPHEMRKATKLVLSTEYRNVTLELKLMGSDEVVRSVNEYMQLIYNKAAKGEFTPRDLVEYFGGLLLAIRKDLGGHDTTLEPIDMLRDWITDIDSLQP